MIHSRHSNIPAIIIITITLDLKDNRNTFIFTVYVSRYHYDLCAQEWLKTAKKEWGPRDHPLLHE